VTIALSGVLPVAAVNTGVAATLPGLSAEIAKLEADITRLGGAVIAQADVSANFPPNAAAFLTTAGLDLTAAEIAAKLNPTNIVQASADANLDLAAELGVVEGQIAIVSGIEAAVAVGLDAGGIAAFSYAGRAQHFGTTLATSTATGFGSFGPDDEISALIIGSESFESWGAFSSGVDTGTSALAEASPGDATLRFLGTDDGARWNFGTGNLAARFATFRALLEGIKASIESQIQVSLGLNLPDLQAMLDASFDIDLDLALDNLVNAQIDLDVEIAAVQLQLDLVLSLVSDLNLQLAAGGLALWTYSGTAGVLGAELVPEVAGGIPQGNGPGAVAYGLVLAGRPPSMQALGAIFGS
jgi:hypothetical protein